MCGGWYGMGGFSWMWMGGSFWFLSLLVVIAIGTFVAVSHSKKNK